MIQDYFAKAHELMGKGEPFVTATVVRAEKPTSAKPGDRAIITIDGIMHGWIGGSCAQPTVIAEALRALADDQSRLIRLSTDPEKQTPREGLIDMAMVCFSGGTLEIFIEPQRPQPRLLIVGSLPIARALAELGRAMNYQVLVVDPETEGAGLPSSARILTDLSEIAPQINPLTYAVIATHGQYDELAAAEVLKGRPAYIGLVASPKRAAAVRQALLDLGFGDSDLLPLKGPAGLDIQARQGEEIALSIMAEIVQRRRSAEQLDLALLRETPAAPEPATAVDPVCHMTVEIETARWTHEHGGATYYFCCAGCQKAFSQNPEKYLAPSAP